MEGKEEEEAVYLLMRLTQPVLRSPFQTSNSPILLFRPSVTMSSSGDRNQKGKRPRRHGDTPNMSLLVAEEMS